MLADTGSKLPSFLLARIPADYFDGISCFAAPPFSGNVLRVNSGAGEGIQNTQKGCDLAHAIDPKNKFPGTCIRTGRYLFITDERDVAIIPPEHRLPAPRQR